MNTKKLLIAIALTATLAACNSSKTSIDGAEQLNDISTTSSDSQSDIQMSNSTEASDIDKDLNLINITDPTQELENSEK